MSRDGEWIRVATAVIFFLLAFVFIIVMFAGAEFRVGRAAENAMWLMVGGFFLIDCNEIVAHYRHGDVAEKKEHLDVRSAYTFAAMALCFLLLDGSVIFFCRLQAEKIVESDSVFALIDCLAILGVGSVFLSVMFMREIYKRSLVAHARSEEPEPEKDIKRALLAS